MLKSKCQQGLSNYRSSLRGGNASAAKHMLLGERSGKRYRLGDRLRIKIVRVDLETSKIDFVLPGKGE